MKLQELFIELGIENQYQKFKKEVEELHTISHYKYIGIGFRKDGYIENNAVVWCDYRYLILNFSHLLTNTIRNGVDEWLRGGYDQSCIVDIDTDEIVY